MTIKYVWHCLWPRCMGVVRMCVNLRMTLCDDCYSKLKELEKKYLREKK